MIGMGFKSLSISLMTLMVVFFMVSSFNNVYAAPDPDDIAVYKIYEVEASSKEQCDTACLWVLLCEKAGD